MWKLDTRLEYESHVDISECVYVRVHLRVSVDTEMNLHLNMA